MTVSPTTYLLARLSGSMTSSKTGSSKSRTLSPFYVTIVTTGLALALDLLVGTFASEATDALYIVAAAASAYAGGFRFGLLSVALGLLPNIGLYNVPHYSLAIGSYGWEHIIVTSVIAAALAYLVGLLRREQQALQSLNKELEIRVNRRTAAFEESNRQLEAFCYTLAHDLRAPLRAIQGFSQIALAENAQAISPESKETLNRISISAEMMGRLIHDLLGYTQLDRTEIPLSPTNLQKLIDRVLQILAPEIADKNGSIQILTPLPTVTSNFALLEQVVLSLLSNALKFSRAGIPPEIRIWSEPHPTTTRVLIEDNGTGIAPQHHENVFQPFRRLDSTPTPLGTGMGLAIAKKGIERLGGKIGIEPHEDHGTRFWLELPN